MIRSPHPAIDLSFMRTRTKNEGGGIAYWNVDSTGRYDTDYSRGRELAEEYLRYVAKYPTYGNRTLLGCIVLDMANDTAKGLKLGFLATVNEHAIAASVLVSSTADNPPTALAVTMDAYQAAEQAFRAEHKRTPDEDHDKLWNAKEAAEMVVLRQPCQSLDDVRQKVRLVLADENVYDSVRNCGLSAETEVLRTFLLSLLGEGATVNEQ